MQKHPMTMAGAEALKLELQSLKSKRQKIVKQIEEARKHGDLKENAEYHAAKEEQGLNEARINQIESKLAHAQLIDISTLPNQGRVVFGSTVTVCQVGKTTELSYQIVGEDEADLKQNKISYSSPLARAMIGKNDGDTVTVQTPGGLVDYDILSVQYT